MERLLLPSSLFLFLLFACHGDRSHPEDGPLSEALDRDSLPVSPEALDDPTGLADKEPEGGPLYDIPAPEEASHSAEDPGAYDLAAPDSPRRCTYERCNGLDDDCDGIVDPPGTYGCTPYYPDEDGDGFGALAPPFCLCAPLGLYRAVVPGDCDDHNKDINPYAQEVCNGLDDNCNGEIDEWTKVFCYRDQDGDGWGSQATLMDCSCPQGYVLAFGDCNDFNPHIHPEAPEDCNGLDDNCNGETDEGLPTVTLYLDNDGDGFPPKGAPSLESCRALPGFAWAKDANGDGIPDFDCDDKDIYVHPGAEEVCDGRDSDCDGIVDPLCFTPCDGLWPYGRPTAGSAMSARLADLDGDGYFETIAQFTSGFAILDYRGIPLYEFLTLEENYSRAPVVLADIDDFDLFGNATQTLEVLSGNGGRPTFYKLNIDLSVSVYTSDESVFDRSRFIACDVDRDGQVEFFTSTWCEKSAGTKVFRFDRDQKKIVFVAAIPDPDGKCEYGDGRFVADLDGDASLELVVGNGHPDATNPSLWAGHIFVYHLWSLFSGPVEPPWDPKLSFNTELQGLFAARVGEMIRFPTRIWAAVQYFKTAIPGAQNETQYLLLEFALDGSLLNVTPFEVPPGLLYPTDVDDDGQVERLLEPAEIGLWDLDGDGLPERIAAEKNILQVEKWDPLNKVYVVEKPSVIEASPDEVTVRSVWDMDRDGRAEVIISDTSGRINCFKLGPRTWNPGTSLPPHLPLYLRTYQWDPFEPNDGQDQNNDGLPDIFTRVPSALTRRGAFYGYLSTPEDVDCYLINTGWNARQCLIAPKARNYALLVYSLFDKWNNDTHEPTKDGRPDGLVWMGETGPGGEVCFHGMDVVPYRTNEYRFISCVRSVEGFSPFRPYWLSAPK